MLYCNVRFAPKADKRPEVSLSPLCANSDRTHHSTPACKPHVIFALRERNSRRQKPVQTCPCYRSTGHEIEAELSSASGTRWYYWPESGIRAGVRILARPRTGGSPDQAAAADRAAAPQVAEAP